jgi:hypothetical protein
MSLVVTLDKSPTVVKGEVYGLLWGITKLPGKLIPLFAPTLRYCLIAAL